MSRYIEVAHRVFSTAPERASKDKLQDRLPPTLVLTAGRLPGRPPTFAADARISVSSLAESRSGVIAARVLA